VRRARAAAAERRESGALGPKRIAAAALIVATAIAWVIPSDVVALVARQDPVLLGRYSEARLVGLALWTLLALPSALMLALGTRPLEVIGRMALATASCALGFVIVSVASRVPIRPRYLETPVGELVSEVGMPLVGTTRRRQPNRVFEIRRKDETGIARSYSHAPPGFPTATITLTTDARGFRNPDPCDDCDVVVAGDSFTEGSMVSDDEVWTALLARRLGVSVYNLGVSGATPRQYLNNLAAFGLPRRPELAIVTVYEGNDFKRLPPPSTPDGDRVELRDRLDRFRRLAFKESPLRERLKRWMIQRLGPVGSDAPLPESLALSWMPLEFRSGGRVHYDAFEPGRMMRLDWEPERFRQAPHWTTNAEVFRQIKALADLRGIRLLMVYAPSTPHVVLPLARSRVAPEALRAFASLVERDLPPAKTFAAQLFDRLDTQERVFLDFCSAEGIECIGLTGALRDAVAAGDQAYFTYDQHWTRVGHEVVAETLARRLRHRPGE
jgi:hypothetical protein